MKIVLIRHGATKGNLEKRYIGRTDEDLCGEGIKKLKEDTCAGIYPPAQAVFSSLGNGCIFLHTFFSHLINIIYQHDSVIYNNTRKHDKTNHGNNADRLSGQQKSQKSSGKRQGNGKHDKKW